MSLPTAATAAIVDIGANVGDFAIAVAQLNPTLHVFAIEPIPQLARHIEDRAAKAELSNLVCIETAVDESTRQATFHVADHHDRGVSSLLNFDSHTISQNDYWRQRPDLHFTNDIVVQVDRMDRLLPWSQIDRIRFLKIDAQGCDMRALRSFGDKIDRVEAGMLEVPGVAESRLYVDDVDDLAAALNGLNELGFSVHAIKPNDHGANEFNLYFHRHGIDWRAIEHELQLGGIHLYDGKHYWHLPSDRFQHYEAELEQGRQSQIELTELKRNLDTFKAQISALEQELSNKENAAVRQERKAANCRAALLEATSEAVSARNKSLEQEARGVQLCAELQLLRGSQEQLLMKKQELLEIAKNQSEEIEFLKLQIQTMQRSRAWRMGNLIRSALSKVR